MSQVPSLPSTDGGNKGDQKASLAFKTRSGKITHAPDIYGTLLIPPPDFRMDQTTNCTDIGTVSSSHPFRRTSKRLVSRLREIDPNVPRNRGDGELYRRFVGSIPGSTEWIESMDIQHMGRAGIHHDSAAPAEVR